MASEGIEPSSSQTTAQSKIVKTGNLLLVYASDQSLIHKVEDIL